jgi:hypothetical protein
LHVGDTSSNSVIWFDIGNKENGEKAMYEIFKAVRLLPSLLPSQDEYRLVSGRKDQRDVFLGSRELSTIEKVQSEDSMVMGSTKEPHGTAEGADDNALAIPTYPEQNHKKRTLQLFFLLFRWRW